MGREKWAARVAADDVTDAAAVWADLDAPADILRACPERVLAHLTEYGSAELLSRVVVNPRLPAPVLSALLDRVQPSTREHLTEELTSLPPPTWVRLAGMFTPVSLSRAVEMLQNPHSLSAGPEAQRTDAAEVLRAFTTSHHPRVRALAAEAFPVAATARHRYKDGTVSAVRFAADPDPAVRRGLARNSRLQNLPEDSAGLAVRRQLLTDADPTVRAAAVRHHVATTSTDVARAVQATYSRLEARYLGVPTAMAVARPEPVLAVEDPLDDPAPQVRAAAVRSIPRAAAARWQRVIADPDARVRAAAATPGWCTPEDVWVRLAQDPEIRVRLAVARSRCAHPELLRKMVGDTDPNVAKQAQARLTPKS